MSLFSSSEQVSAENLANRAVVLGPSRKPTFYYQVVMLIIKIR